MEGSGSDPMTINAPSSSSLGKHFPSPPPPPAMEPPAGYIPVPPPPPPAGYIPVPPPPPADGSKSMISPVVNKKMALPSLPADLMTAIREGIALKKVPETAKSEKSANSQTVAATILARRIAMQMSYSDDESADSKGGSDWDA